MKKRVLLSVLLVSMFGQAWTQTFQIEDLWYSFTSDSTVEVCRGDYSEIIAVTIPEIVNYEGNQYVVKGIGDNAFYNYFTYPNLTSVIIPNSVTSIGKQSFCACVNLTTISIPNTVMTIGYNAFSSCGKLDYNTFDNAYYIGNENNPYMVLVEAKNKNITTCEINNNCRFIYDEAFEDCKDLWEISMPNNIVGIGHDAFWGCYSLKSITIPESVLYTGESPFFWSGLSKIEIKSIESLCNIKMESRLTDATHQLYINGQLITDLIIPDGVKNIGNGAFANCSLKTVVIPNSVTSIDCGAFFECKDLLSVTIGNGVTSIGSDVFWWCSNLKTVIIGSSVNINGDTFRGCDNINTVVCMAAEPPTLNDDPFSSVDNVYVPINYVEAYKSSPIWKRKEILPFYRVKATSADIITGTVQGDSLLLGDNSAIITAIPTEGYHFVKWSDGNTDNPRVYSTKSDTSFTAIFEKHNIVTDAAVAATATESGLTEGSHCSVCGKVIVAQEVISVLGEQGGENTNPTTAVTESAANTINIYAIGNTIVVENATEEIRVYNAMGALVGRDAINRVRTEIPVNGTGVYIVKIGGTVKLVVVD